MNDYAITIKSEEREGILNDITSLISDLGVNITYTHLFVDSRNIGTINFELENVSNIDALIELIDSIDGVKSTELHSSSNDIFGKRILIIGGGAQVSQVAMGAITEADRHNIRGERISVDTIPLVGEQNIAEAVDAILRLPRIHALVLAGSLMGGDIIDAVKKIKTEDKIIVISLNMPGGVTDVADLVVTDPIQAGVMAVMAIADTAVFDIKKLKGNNKF